MDNPEKLATLDTQDEDKQNVKHSAIYVGHHYTQANTNNVNKTRVLLQTEHRLYAEIITGTSQHGSTHNRTTTKLK